MTPGAPLRQLTQVCVPRDARWLHRRHFFVAGSDGGGYPTTMTPTLPAPPPEARFSAAAERNTGPILEVLRAHLPVQGSVLEIAAGTGQHASAFARALPSLDWTPSDPDPEARASIVAWRGVADAVNLREPLALDVRERQSWPDRQWSAIVCINMVHISPWAATEALMEMAGRTLAPAGLLALYGPYREADAPLADSNAAFDESLKARDPDWGLRDRDDVIAQAKARGLAFTLRKALPANNLMLLFRRA
jgi:SAM-dependent methyltransferase